MEKNGKYFLPPLEKQSSLKEMFHQLVSSGAGRSVDNDGLPDGPWSPIELTEALERYDETGSGIDLRTVQLWFQNNRRGISRQNIRLLARVFGCDDAESTLVWQRELLTAKTRLDDERKRKGGATKEQKTETSNPVTVTPKGVPSDVAPPVVESALRTFRTIANITEEMFSIWATLNLPVFILAGSVTLGFIAFVCGIGNVTYSHSSGVSKQVGFFWAPNWVVIQMILLPMFMIVVSDVLGLWRRDIRQHFFGSDYDDNDSWPRVVEKYSFCFWVLLGICVFVIFFLQWAGFYLRALRADDLGGLHVDWLLVSIVRPDVLSNITSLIVSLLALLYVAAICYLFLGGQILLSIVAQDFRELAKTRSNLSIEWKYFADRFMYSLFRCTVLGALVSLCFKLQVVYLMTETPDILSWLVYDFSNVFLGGEFRSANVLGLSGIAPFSSFLLLVTTLAVFVFGSFRVHVFMASMSGAVDAGDLDSEQDAASMSLLYMYLAVLTLVVTYFSVGVVPGFSVLVIVSVIIGTYSLVDPHWNVRFRERGVF